MKHSTALAICGVLGVSGGATALAASKTGGWGYMDAATGKFTAVTHENPKTPPAKVVSGTFVINITATVNPSIVAADTLYCNASVFYEDSAGTDTIEVDAFKATRSGSSATCSIKLPYRWGVAASTGDVDISYGISTLVEAEGAVNHYFTSALERALPATGSTTTIPVVADL